MPVTYGTLDGISFYDQLMNNASAAHRDCSYNWYDVNRFGPDTIPPIAWSLDTAYKVIDGKQSIIDYNTDVFDRHPIQLSGMTFDQKSDYQYLQSNNAKYH